ncbi:hypothetical protein [Blastococcus brunescens]|uniref:Uncharacterized protein n=1 Tax=Blastococcus brunescens TaxID=1564165 RepID=A0ABZ1AUE0_9ACTN|nr:hypothetical protein [Blastococcus sp. BMG 8361]WRL62182.1 hypothetical protein U6N30_19285 [Blastococcus sp. BMG 8361]
MGRRRKAGKYPYDYTDADDRRFVDSGAGGTLRVLHGPGRGMGVPDGVVCRVEVLAADGSFVDESAAGKFGKEHRLHRTVPGDRITATVTAGFEDDGECACGSAGCVPVLEELTATSVVVLTGDLDDVVRFGVGPAWETVVAIDEGHQWPQDQDSPTACRWGAGVRIRAARPIADAPDVP